MNALMLAASQQAMQQAMQQAVQQAMGPHGVGEVAAGGAGVNLQTAATASSSAFSTTMLGTDGHPEALSVQQQLPVRLPKRP
jgi:hypothetical protein